MNSQFRLSNATKKRYRVECGSAGSGKSVNVARDFIIKLSDKNYKGANLLCVRKTEASHLDSTYAELCRAVSEIFGDRADEFWKVSRSPLKMYCTKTGNSIIFRGTKDETQREKLKSIQSLSGKIVWVWVEEATELEKGDLEIIDDRLRGDLREINPNLYYQITLTFNPVSANHWIKKRFFDRCDSDVYTHKSNYLQNRFIDDAYHKRMLRRKELDPDGYRVYGLGEWGETQGQILSRFSVENCDKEFESYDFVNIGQDFGFNHANCVLTVGFRDGNVYVLSELYTKGLDTGEIISKADEMKISKTVPMWCDSAEPDRIKTWKKAGYFALPVKKEPGSIKAQIEYLKNHTLTIDVSCENLINEISEWKWQRDANGEFTDTPTEINDDAIAALRYSLESVRKGNRLRSISKKSLGI